MCACQPILTGAVRCTPPSAQTMSQASPASSSAGHKVQRIMSHTLAHHYMCFARPPLTPTQCPQAQSSSQLMLDQESGASAWKNFVFVFASHAHSGTHTHTHTHMHTNPNSSHPSHHTHPNAASPWHRGHCLFRQWTRCPWPHAHTHTHAHTNGTEILPVPHHHTLTAAPPTSSANLDAAFTARRSTSTTSRTVDDAIPPAQQGGVALNTFTKQVTPF